MDTQFTSEQALLKALSNLDITPTMEANAREKYEAVAEYLSEHGVEANFYPQGSFRLGTVTRPFRQGKDVSYDLDVVCQVLEDKQQVTPGYVKNLIGDPLKESGLYADKLLSEDDRCWTLEYAKVDDKTGFNLDLVPSVNQDMTLIERLVLAGIPRDKATVAIAITEKTADDGDYGWQNSNPKGYAMWFDEINAPFLAEVEHEQRRRIFEFNRQLYASIEEVPKILIRSPLQRAIQILKRHRDVYYYRAGAENCKPISAIITTLAAQFAKGLHPAIGVVELLEHITLELGQYSELLQDEDNRDHSVFETRTLLKRDEKGWYIGNPVDPFDNYADGWDERTAELFFSWSRVVKEELVDTVDSSERMLRSLVSSLSIAGLENALGTNRKLSPVEITPTKPWRSMV